MDIAYPRSKVSSARSCFTDLVLMVPLCLPKKGNNEVEQQSA